MYVFPRLSTRCRAICSRLYVLSCSIRGSHDMCLFVFPGFTSLLGFLSAGATCAAEFACLHSASNPFSVRLHEWTRFLLCVALGVVVGCAIRRFIVRSSVKFDKAGNSLSVLAKVSSLPPSVFKVGDPAPNARRRRRGSQPRSKVVSSLKREAEKATYIYIWIHHFIDTT